MRQRYDPDYQERNAFSTLYCINDHPLFGDNMTLVSISYGRYRRYCKACRREAVDRYVAGNQEATLLAKTMRRADRVAARKLQAREQLLSLRQTAHLIPDSTLVLLVGRLIDAL